MSSYLDLSDTEVQKGHAITNFDGTLGSNTAHGGSETTVEFQNGEFVQVRAGLDLGDIVIGYDLVFWRRPDLVPIDLSTLASLTQPAVEEQEEAAHFVLEVLVAICMISRQSVERTNTNLPSSSIA